MEKEILNEICNDLNWIERIIVRLFKRTFVNAYKNGVKTGFNW